MHLNNLEMFGVALIVVGIMIVLAAPLLDWMIGKAQ